MSETILLGVVVALLVWHSYQVKQISAVWRELFSSMFEIAEQERTAIELLVKHLKRNQ